MTLKIHIVYCGGWGYAPKFRKLKTELEGKFPGQLDITGEGTPGTTGWLEVQIVDGELLHSKKNGDGYVDTKAKMDKIIAGVEKAWLPELKLCSLRFLGWIVK